MKTLKHCTDLVVSLWNFSRNECLFEILIVGLDAILRVFAQERIVREYEDLLRKTSSGIFYDVYHSHCLIDGSAGALITVAKSLVNA